eukprot:1433839-Lingulodinium_polyedra.AAC.1
MENDLNFGRKEVDGVELQTTGLDLPPLQDLGAGGLSPTLGDDGVLVARSRSGAAASDISGT